MSNREAQEPWSAVATGEQSPNWDKYDSLNFTPEQKIESDGEPLPPDSPSEQLYQLITRSGERLIGKPRYSSPFDSSYGSGWSVEVDKQKVIYSSFAVIAWRKV